MLWIRRSDAAVHVLTIGRDGVRCVAVHGVAAVPTAHHVPPVSAGVDEVVAGATGMRVDPFVPPQYVVAGAARQRVVAVVTRECRRRRSGVGHAVGSIAGAHGDPDDAGGRTGGRVADRGAGRGPGDRGPRVDKRVVRSREPDGEIVNLPGRGRIEDTLDSRARRARQGPRRKHRKHRHCCDSQAQPDLAMPSPFSHVSQRDPAYGRRSRSRIAPNGDLCASDGGPYSGYSRVLASASRRASTAASRVRAALRAVRMIKAAKGTSPRSYFWIAFVRLANTTCVMSSAACGSRTMLRTSAQTLSANRT